MPYIQTKNDDGTETSTWTPPKDLEGSGHELRQLVAEIAVAVPRGAKERRLLRNIHQAVEAVGSSQAASRELEMTITRLWIHLVGLMETFRTLQGDRGAARDVPDRAGTGKEGG